MIVFLIISFIGVCVYFCWSMYLFLFKIKIIRRSKSIDNQISLFILIPVLNESSVLTKTIESYNALMDDAKISIKLVVVDDDSNDGTTELVHHLASEHEYVMPVYRKLPAAQKGKGDALNEGLVHIKSYIKEYNINPEYTIVGVLDADATINMDSLSIVIRTFYDDPSIAMVQTAVGMNKTNTWIQRMQDMEFQSCNVLIQNARNHLNNAAGSGNGQFFKYVIFKDQTDPWGNSLLEDFEISTRILLGKLKTVFVPDAVVYQEPVSKYKAFITQRTRWAHGGVECINKYGKKIMQSSLKKMGKFEMFFYMVLPIFTALTFVCHTFSLFYHFYLVFILGNNVDLVLIAILLISFFISNIIGLIYHRRTNYSLLKSILWSLTIPFYNVLLVPSSFRALFHYISSNKVWEKTDHSNT